VIFRLSKFQKLGKSNAFFSTLTAFGTLLGVYFAVFFCRVVARRDPAFQP